MRIRQKLLASFLFISLLTLGISFGTSFLVQEKTMTIFQEVGGEILPGDIALSRMTTELYHTLVLLEKYEENPDDAIRVAIDKTLSSLDAHKVMHDLFHRKDKLSPQIDQLTQEFSRSVAQYVLLLQKGTDKEKVLAVRQKIDTLLEQFVGSINPTIEEGFEVSYRKIVDVQEMNLQSRWILIVSGIVILLIALMLSIFIANIFSKPLRSLRDAAKKIGGGHLDLTIPVTSKDEIGDLARAFNDMGKNLTTMRVEEKRLEQALHRAQKMDAVGKLTGGIAHDFNNMLGVILGYSDLLLRKVDNDPTLEKYAKQIQHAGERAKILTAKLLSFSRKESISAEPTDINQLILDSRHMLEKTLTPRIELILELADDLWPVYLDESSLEDAILNMSINAMHAIPENGSLTLATSNIHLESDELHQMEIEAGDYIFFTMTDTGIGMDQETQQRIFDPFFSTKGERGTGLGMSQVYSFVQQTGGAIAVDSEVGHGTQITFYLPRYLSAVVSGTEEKEAVLEEVPSGHETILVVDDEAALREFTAEILTAHGYRVLCAESGEKALEILETESIALLLSDVIMPHMDGYQLAEKVEENYPLIKIQMVSGFVDKHYVTKNKELHNRRLKKPFRSEILLQRVRELIDEGNVISELELIHPIEWSEEISTGIEQVDEDHKILVSLLNRCISAVGSINQDEEIRTILAELLDYTNFHFRREEAVMAACSYPNLHTHMQAHNQLIESVNQRIREFGNGTLEAKLLLKFIRNWLTNHIINQDRDIIPYCQGKERLIEQALRDAELNNSTDD